MKISPFGTDLHIHSCLSPCGGDDMTPPAIIKHLKMMEIDIFSISDHNGIHNCRAFSNAAEREGLIFIPGIELQTVEEVHLLGYFPKVKTLEEFYETEIKPYLTPGKNDPDSFGSQIIISHTGKEKDICEDLLALPLMLELDVLTETIHNYNGLAVPAHLDKNFSVISQLAFVPPNLVVDGFEIYMTNKAEKMKKEYLNDRTEPLVSSSDAHHIHHLIKPKMRFWLKHKLIGEVFSAFKGLEERRITLSYGTSSNSKTKIASSGTLGTSSSSGGWVKPPWER